MWKQVHRERWKCWKTRLLLIVFTATGCLVNISNHDKVWSEACSIQVLAISTCSSSLRVWIWQMWTRAWWDTCPGDNSVWNAVSCSTGFTCMWEIKSYLRFYLKSLQTLNYRGKALFWWPGRAKSCHIVVCGLIFSKRWWCVGYSLVPDFTQKLCLNEICNGDLWGVRVDPLACSQCEYTCS